MGWNRRLMMWVAVSALLPAVRAVAVGPDIAGCNADHRVTVAVRRDALLSSKWAVMVDCAHPEWPARMVMLTDEDAEKVVMPAAEIRSMRVDPVAPIVVRAGETVRLWSQDGVTRMETTGVAQESGAAGKRVRVRLVRQGMNSDEAERFLTGVVDGPGSVEIVR